MAPALASPASMSGADMIAGENDLAACSLRADCQIDASSNLHVGEKSPDFAMRSGLDVSSRVPKVTSAAYDRSSISPSGTGADALISAMSRRAVAIVQLLDVLAATEPLSRCQPKLEEDEPLHGPRHIRVGYELSAVPIPPLEAKLHAL